MAYLTLAAFQLKSAIPAEFVDEIELHTPGWIDEQIADESARLDARLSKRYEAPFRDPAPRIVGVWIARIVSLNAWLKRGVSATDETFAEFVKQHDQALEEITEAANAETGLFELPLRGDTNAGGVVRGTPRSYSEQSPYAWSDGQAATGRLEDAAKIGSLR